jgi:hypothetical protein
MSTLPRSQSGLIMAAVIAVVGAVVGGVILVTSSSASDVNLTSARFVPADAGLYVAFNTDLSSSQWVSAFNIIEKLGEKDPKGQLKSSAKEGGNIDWDHDVAPFLGGNAAFYLHGGTSILDADFAGAVILRCTDSARALEVVIEQSGGEFTTEEYEGASYRSDEGSGLFLADLDHHLVVATSRETMEEVIDVHSGKTASLDGVSDFKNLRDEVSGDFLAFVYLNSERLFGDAFLNDPLVKEALDKSGAGDLAFKPVAAVIGAKGRAFQFQEASLGSADSVSPLLTPHTSHFAGVVPADTAVFYSTNNIAQTWDSITKAAGDQIDEAIRDEGTYRNLDDALRAGGKELGLPSARDLIDLFTGETAVAAWFPDHTEDNAEWVLLGDVTDTGTAATALASVASSATSGSVHTDTANGVQVTLFDDGDGNALAYAIRDSYILIGSEAGVRKVLAGGDTLAASKTYANTLKQMPSALGTYAYLDMSSLVSLAGSGGVPAELDDAQKALEGMVINWVEERGVVRFNGILSVKD